MIERKKQRSTVRPEPIEITEYDVFVSTNIVEITDTETEFVGWEFDQTQYTKDEYIKLTSERNTDLETQLTDTQVALCDIYEMIGG